MLGPVDYFIWLIVLLAELCCVACVLKKKAFFQHFTIVLYFCSSIGVSVGRFLLLMAAGLNSNSYFYFYYYSDAVLTICLFFILMSFYAHVFSEMGVGKMVR